LRDKNVGDWISEESPDEELGVVKFVAAVDGVPGDNNRTKDNREGDAKHSVSTPAVRAREFDQAATKPPLDHFVTFSDTVDSSGASVNYCLFGNR
jgi:hypothetical protein